jgi:hypothetical protein
MVKSLYLVTLALIFQACPTLAARVTSPNKVPKNAVLLSNVKTLTVHANKKTASRRVSPVPQLQCVGPPSVCQLYAIDVMRCANEGSDYDAESIQWACKASLPEEFKLGSTDVSCEGYESSEDPYVLKGSCGVEYRLLLTEQGEEKYGRKNDAVQGGHISGTSEEIASIVFVAIFFGVLFIILRSLYRAWQRDGRRPGGDRLGGGGGWGGGPDDDDPPPPYDDFSYRPPKKRAYTPRTTTGTRASSSRAGNNQQGWRPGFWTGTAAGAAAGYLAGNRNQARPQPETAQQRTGGGLFGGGGGSSWGRQPSSSSSPSSSTPSYSSSRHESTGFGGTSRR